MKWLVVMVLVALAGCTNETVDLGDEGCPSPDAVVGDDDAGAGDVESDADVAEEDAEPPAEAVDGDDDAPTCPATCNPEACQEVCYTALGAPQPGGCFTIKDGCWWCMCEQDDGLYVKVDEGAGCP